jgi:hypothetical protein
MKGDEPMKRSVFLLAFVLAWGLALTWSVRATAADEPAKVAGTWEMTFEGRNGTVTRTLTIEQDGGTINGSMEGRRGPAPLEGSVQGNKISFTVKRETPNGTFTLEYSGTVEGDAMKGTVHTPRFDREWTATRTGETGKK